VGVRKNGNLEGLATFAQVAPAGSLRFIFAPPPLKRWGTRRTKVTYAGPAFNRGCRIPHALVSWGYNGDHVWAAENRLHSVTPIAPVDGTSEKVEFACNYMDWRVENGRTWYHEELYKLENLPDISSGPGTTMRAIRGRGGG